MEGGVNGEWAMLDEGLTAKDAETNALVPQKAGKKRKEEYSLCSPRAVVP